MRKKLLPTTSSPYQNRHKIFTRYNKSLYIKKLMTLREGLITHPHGPWSMDLNLPSAGSISHSVVLFCSSSSSFFACHQLSSGSSMLSLSLTFCDPSVITYVLSFLQFHSIPVLLLVYVFCPIWSGSLVLQCVCPLPFSYHP